MDGIVNMGGRWALHGWDVYLEFMESEPVAAKVRIREWPYDSGRCDTVAVSSGAV